ncbi:MAG: FAD-dependent oxidoreductase [Chromatiales bacterium]|nr:FAD-dependent oxidoreductase [Chromatiales bacterium]
MSASNSKRITIVGTGFGALTAVRKLRSLDANAQITVVSPRPEFLYYPSLVWIPSRMRESSDLVVNLDAFFQRMNVHYHQGSASGLKEGGRTLVTDTGELPNDGLIIASGGRYLTKLPGIDNAAIPCRSLTDAERFRDQLEALDGGTVAFGFGGNPKEPSAMRGGPVFEYLFGTHTLLKKQKRRDRFQLKFFAPAKRPGQRMGDAAVDRLLEAMRKRDIQTHLGHPLKAFHPNRIETEGESFDTDLIVFIPGMTGSTWTQATDLPQSPGGFVQSDANCKVAGFDRVYVVGDAGSYPGPEWMPKQAHMADLQAIAACKNLMSEFAGEPAQASFKVELACIVDSLDSGMLVARSGTRSLMLPATRLLHWSKRLFEWNYMRQYR